MSNQTASNRLRALPSVDALLRTGEALALRERVGGERLTALARLVTDELRAELLSSETDGTQAQAMPQAAQAMSEAAAPSREALLEEAARRLELAAVREERTALRRVINATGVILHTNLGRAPLSEAARERVSQEAARYCTLEYDTETGARGRRGARVEELLMELTGAEAALVVNNCAAASLLVLTVLASDGETIVSRGELVEIGGDFRVPDVLVQSGTTMVEVGTTNRTKLADYRRAVNDRTRLILRVHPSNYRIVGFTAAPSLEELAALAEEHRLPLFEDAGSGALVDLSPYGLGDEPVIRQSVERGAGLVSFSGDKLLGAAQAGLIVGRRTLVEALRRHPLYRALRADKLALAALEATLDAHRRARSFAEVPALRMLSATREEIGERARRFTTRLGERTTTDALASALVEGESAIGGGSAPTTHPPTILIALTHRSLSASALEEKLRRRVPVAVVARILEERVLLDLRTVADDEEDELLEALVSVSAVSLSA